VPGSALEVASTKYDGSMHYRYPATVVDDTGDRLRAWVPAGTPMRSYRGDRRSPRHFLRVHETCRDWNLEVMWEPDWRPSKHYVNIALPSTWHDGTLRFVDLDLDISWWFDGRVVLLDVDEFTEHRDRFGYPDDVVERAWAAVDEVRGLISMRTPPFDRSLYAWRPSQDLRASRE
jgi:protein associated with RNAse G/E